MRKTLIILLLISSTSSFAQTYFPFPDSVGVWKQSTEMNEMTSSSYIYYALFLKGDTLINSNIYKKIFYSQDPNYLDSVNSPYYGALREENKRIYFYPDSSFANNYNFCFTNSFPLPSINYELLLYDFNANIGDTIVYPHLDSLKMAIISVDSVLIQSNYRKKYNYYLIQSNSSSQCNPWGAGYNYVEGIGDITSGLFSLYKYYFENAEHLNCFEDDEVSYSNVSDCMTVGINMIRTDELFELYPNPASNKLFIELEYPTRTKVLVYNISGKEVYSSFINQTKSIIDVSSFKSGLYLVKFIDEHGISKSKLISIH